jgi:hypothetical protein
VCNYYKHYCVERIKSAQDGFQRLTTIITLVNFEVT